MDSLWVIRCSTEMRVIARDEKHAERIFRKWIRDRNVTVTSDLHYGPALDPISELPR